VKQRAGPSRGPLAAHDQRGVVARAEGEMNDADARLWHPWLRINRVLRVMLHTRWSAEAWAQVRVEFTKALAHSGAPDSSPDIRLAAKGTRRGHP
jgi:hypothetical protein